LANGDSVLSPVGDILGEFHQLLIFSVHRLRAKKGKKKGRNARENCAVPTQQNGENMKRKNTKRKRQQDCDVEKAIDTFKKAADTAVKVYRTVEPIVKTIVAHRRKTK